MRKIVLFFVLLLIVAGIGGFFTLGLFPPRLPQTVVTVSLPNSRIASPAAAVTPAAAPAPAAAH